MLFHSVIYLSVLPSNAPCGLRAGSPNMSLVYANLQPPDSTASDVAIVAGELLPHLLTLTARLTEGAVIFFCVS